MFSGSPEPIHVPLNLHVRRRCCSKRLEFLSTIEGALRPITLAWPAAGLVIGLAAQFSGWGQWAGPIWAIATIPVLVVLLAEIVVSLRRGDVGLDIVAALSMFAALVFGEYLAAVVVALMYAGGQYLESFAERHAGREMTALLARVPRTAIRYRDGRLEEVDLDVIEPGDRLAGAKGRCGSGRWRGDGRLAVLDQSALTGEFDADPAADRRSGDERIDECRRGVPSPCFAARGREHLCGHVRLVEAAQRSRAPMSRLADRYAMVFLAATVALAGAALLWSGDPIRAVAVLVIATPCPLILAVPVALVSGLSRAAKHGILIKGGQALEKLARVRALVIDKTGTLTRGEAVFSRSTWFGSAGQRSTAARGLTRSGLQAHHGANHRGRGAEARASTSPCPAMFSKRRAKASKVAWMAGM